MSKKQLFALKTTISILLIFAIHIAFNYDRIKIDGKRAEVYSLFFGEDTKYSKDFSHRNFRKLKIGMTEKQAVEILGQPLSKFAYNFTNNKNYHNGAFVGFKYSESPNSKDYRLRIIHLNQKFIVAIIGEFYFD